MLRTTLPQKSKVESEKNNICVRGKPEVDRRGELVAGKEIAGLHRMMVYKVELTSVLNTGLLLGEVT